MKIRQSFISNSSSSSFICLIKEEAYNKAFEAASTETKQILLKTREVGVTLEPVDVFGSKSIIFHFNFDMSGDSIFSEIEVELETEDCYSPFLDFLRTIPDDDLFTHEEF